MENNVILNETSLRELSKDELLEVEGGNPDSGDWLAFGIGLLIGLAWSYIASRQEAGRAR